jgi:DNA-binding CsgD family transcriptional regulator
MELTFTADVARRDALSAEAVVAARRLGEAAALIQALHARHYALGGPERLDERLAIADELVAAAATTGAKDALALGRGWRFGDLMEAGELDGADRDLAAFAALATELQQPLLLWRAAMWRAMRALLEGRFAEAERLIAEAGQLGRRTQNPDLPLTVGAQRHVLRRQRRGLTEADLAAALADRRQQGWGAVQDPWLVRLAADLGRREEAQAGLNRLAAQDFAGLAGGSSRLTGLALLAEAAARLGDRRHAASLYALLAPFAARPVMAGGTTACHGAVAYYLALLATTVERWPEAEAHFQEAAALHERLGARAYLAQTWLDHGRMLLARGRPGDDERAADLVAKARDLAAELGMAPLTEAAARLLERRQAPPAMGRRGSGAPAPSPPAYPDGLTAREVEVLRLLAAGLTNKEIAAALVVSDRTVGNHIANLYAKIGARRRADATAYALRHGLVAPEQPPQA